MNKLILLSLSLLMISACQAMDESDAAQDYKDYRAYLPNERITEHLLKKLQHSYQADWRETTYDHYDPNCELAKKYDFINLDPKSVKQFYFSNTRIRKGGRKFECKIDNFNISRRFNRHLMTIALKHDFIGKLKELDTYITLPTDETALFERMLEFDTKGNASDGLTECYKESDRDYESKNKKRIYSCITKISDKEFNKRLGIQNRILTKRCPCSQKPGL